MKRTVGLVFASASFCLAAVLLAGCSTSQDTSDEGLFPPKAKSAASVLTELVSQGVGKIEGTVTYEGDPPAVKEIEAIKANADRDKCMKGNIQDPTWVVDPSSKGVANVVVWVQAPKGSYFKKPEKMTWPEAVTVDQPFCAFVPHVVVLYPQYYDGKQLAATGQTLTVLNTADMAHNIKMGGSSDKNPTQGGTLPAATGRQDFGAIQVDSRELSLNCDIHKWMSGYALTFDHPYAIVTDAKGKFVIENVPAGVELLFRGWHEDLKRIDPAVEGGSKIKLEAGKTKTLNFTVRKK